MHDKKLIKKIFGLARYDFIQNFNNWVFMTGLLAAVIMTVVGLLCFVTKNYDLHLWKLPHLMIQAWIDSFASLSSYLWNNSGNTYYHAESLFLAVGLPFLMFPIIIMQNCLDLAFDSAMSGFTMSVDISYKFCVEQISLLFINVVCFGNFLAIWLLLPTIIFYNDVFRSVVSIMLSLLLIFNWQTISLMQLHMLEYKKNLFVSLQDLYGMIKNKQILLFKILVLQICAGGLSIAGIYFLLNPVIKVFLRFMLWPCKILQLSVPSIIVIMLSNFFYVWAYLMVYAWIYLVLAHVYRQLVCPPVDNASCPSCTSCEK